MKISKYVLQVVSILIIGCITTISALAQNPADEIIGVWELEDKASKMEIYKEGDLYFGKLLYGKDVVNEDGTSKKDTKNPDSNLRGQDIIGSTYIKDLQFDGDEWEDGKVYDSSTGKTWNCYIQIKKGELHFTGYIGAKWLGKTYVYTRVK